MLSLSLLSSEGCQVPKRRPTNFANTVSHAYTQQIVISDMRNSNGNFTFEPLAYPTLLFDQTYFTAHIN